MLREVLRLSTRVYHERLETKLAILQSLQTMNDYIRLLEYFYGFYVPVESILTQFSDHFESRNFDIRSRLKIPKLIADLQALGLTSKEIDRIPLCQDLPDLSDYPLALGCVYVLEGATLGGQILARYCLQTLQLKPNSGAQFISGYGLETPEMWNRFVEFLNAQEGPALDAAEVVAAARATFECLERWTYDFPSR